MKLLNRLLLTALLGLAVASPAQAQWKWRDAGGRIQYSDRPPPPGIADRDVLVRPAPAAVVSGAVRGALVSGPTASASAVATAPAAASAAASAAARSDPALEAKRRDAERAEAARQKLETDKVAAAQAENCQRARTQLRTLDDGMRIARVNQNGEREYLDDSARAAETARARSVIASDCR